MVQKTQKFDSSDARKQTWNVSVGLSKDATYMTSVNALHEVHIAKYTLVLTQRSMKAVGRMVYCLVNYVLKANCFQVKWF